MSETNGNGVPTSFVFGAFALSTTCVIRVVSVVITPPIICVIIAVTVFSAMSIVGSPMLGATAPRTTALALVSMGGIRAVGMLG